jgi:hypothetical protein
VQNKQPLWYNRSGCLFFRRCVFLLNACLKPSLKHVQLYLQHENMVKANRIDALLLLEPS